jgi:hypothetical protein
VCQERAFERRAFPREEPDLLAFRVAADEDFERLRAPGEAELERLRVLGEADFARRRAALFACRESAVLDTTDFGSRSRAFFTARLRRGELRRGLRSPCPTSYARSADSRVRFEL